MIVIGDPLRFILTWESDTPTGTAAEATRGTLAAYVSDRQIWGQNGSGFLWSWVELLEHLADTWTFLEWEEVDPLGLGESPEYLRLAAARRWEETPTSPEGEEVDLWEFERCHNLAAGLQGAWPRDLWLLRQGNTYVVSGGGVRLTERREAILETLNRLGDEIAARLLNSEDARARAVVTAWRGRREIPIERFVTAATSLKPGTIDVLVGNQDPWSFWELGNALEPTEVLAAARMIGPDLAPNEIRRILQKIRRLPKQRTQALDQLSRTAEALLSGDLPFEQGYRVATWLRKQLSVNHAPTDPRDLLADWGVRVVFDELPSRLIDAVACWGQAHGPAVIVNNVGRHASGLAGRRATLAHEIAHLLIDRQKFLPLAEVLGGRMPRAIEARARAFAAELLLPRSIAGEALASSSKDPEGDVRRLCRRYGVSQEIVAWQARNSMLPLRAAVTAYLRPLVSRPDAFFP
jgi:Zn-dependent peptidase ImmA (M78 family)